MKFLVLLFLVPLTFAADDAFEADNKIIKHEGQAQIEQFISTKNLTTVKNKDEMTLQTLLYTPSETEKPQEFYEAAVENLKKFSPKLRLLHLFGGHTFYPENSTVKSVQEEIAYTKDHLKALIKALNKNKITVTSNILTVMLVVDEKCQTESNFEEIISKQFGKDSIVDDSNQDGLELLFKIDGIDLHLYFVFINNLEAVKKTKLPYGRTAYARSISEFLDPIYEELEARSKDRIKFDETKLFVAGVKRLNRAGELHLEEFYDEKFINPQLKDRTPQDTLEQLVLSVGVPQLVNQSAEEFYTQAVKNLKKYAPNLKNVRLDGGYAFNPEKIDNETIKNEVIFFHNNLEAVLKAFGDEGITVSSLKLKVYWLSSKKHSEEHGYPSLIKTSFNYEPTEADVESGKILMTFKMQKIQPSVDLHFFDKAPKELPFGRTNYYTAAKLHEEANAKRGKDAKSSESNSKSSESNSKSSEEKPKH
jgi:hypothetical protein